MLNLMASGFFIFGCRSFVEYPKTSSMHMVC